MGWSDKLAPTSPTYEIASSTSSDICLIAGPGTGKSFTMMTRIRRLLEEGVLPENILAVTFTNVAANDLHQELTNMSVDGADRLKAQTLHSLTFGILSRNHVLTSTSRVPRPLLDYEHDPMMADLKHHGGKKKIGKFINALGAAWLKLEIVSLDEVSDHKIRSFERDLESWLVYHRSMLLDEIVPETRAYLERNPAASERREYTHILVDEYQDLNKAEQHTLELLADNAETCIIGDDDQSLYSFKHAYPTGLQDWMEANPAHARFTIEDCHRCPVNVVELANSIISYNTDRIEKQLNAIPSKGDGLVNICQYNSLSLEIEGVVSFISQCIDAGVPPSDILVLAQRGKIGIPIYQKLQEASIPAKSYYRETALEDLAAREKFALFTLFVNRDDRVSLRWLLGANSSTWLSGAYKKLRKYCEANAQSPYEALERQHEGSITISGITNLSNRFNEIIMELKKLETLSSLEEIVNALFSGGDESLEQLRRTALIEMKNNETITTEELHKAMLTKLSRPEEADECEEVRIMSLHKSKGLSSPITIIAGCVDGLLPKQPDENLPQNKQDALLQEQRRLFYVGMTRVKAEPCEGKKGVLIVTSSRSMSVADALGSGIDFSYVRRGNASLQSSRFLSELGDSAPLHTLGITINPNKDLV